MLPMAIQGAFTWISFDLAVNAFVVIP